MNLVLSALSGNSIVSLVLFGIIVALIVLIAVMYALWKKGKYHSRGQFFFGLDALIRQVAPLCKQKYLTNPLAGEKIFVWTVLCLGVANAGLLLTLDIVQKAFTLDFLFALFFVFILAMMIAVDYKLAPRAPYYYEYNPSLFVYAAVVLFFGFISFVSSVASGALWNFLFGALAFVGCLLLYGLLVLMRFFKREFKPLSLLIYLGALITVGVNISKFALYQVSANALYVAHYAVSLAYETGVVLAVLYVYDRFSFPRALVK